MNVVSHSGWLSPCKSEDRGQTQQTWEEHGPTRRRGPCAGASRIRSLPVTVDKVEGAVLVDQVKSLDWAARRARRHSQADAAMLSKVRTYLGVLLGIT